MSDVELRDELMTLLTAGHETTATALSWAVERLHAHARGHGAARVPTWTTTPTSTRWCARRCACAR